MKITLLNCFTTRPVKKRDVVDIHKKKRDVIVLPSLEIPLGKPVPKGRFVSGYGTKAASQILKMERKKNLKSKKDFYRVDIEIEGGDIPPGRVSMEDLPNIYFLNLERMTAEISEMIFNIVTYENEPLDNETAMSVLGKYPDRFDLLWENPTFKHISAFSWNAPISVSGPKRFVKLAITRNIRLFENVVIRNYVNDSPEIQFLV
jgi:hypothetical protein